MPGSEKNLHNSLEKEESFDFVERPEAQDEEAKTYTAALIYSRGGEGHYAGGLAVKNADLANKYLVVEIVAQKWMSLNSPNVVMQRSSINNLWEKAKATVINRYLRLDDNDKNDLGKFGVQVWDEAQRLGDIEQQKELVQQQEGAEGLFDEHFFYQTLLLLRTHGEIIKVVSTQPLCLHKIIEAVAIVSEERKAVAIASKECDERPIKNWPITVKIVVTDYLTDEATHFYISLRKIRAEILKKVSVTLYTPHPKPMHLGPQQIAKELDYHNEIERKIPEFYFDTPKGITSRVQFTKGPLRAAFLERPFKQKNVPLIVKLDSEHQKALLELHPEMIASQDDATVAITLPPSPPSARVHAIMLGSKASETGTYACIKGRCAAYLTQKKINHIEYVYAFVGDNENLYQDVLTYAQTMREQTRGKLCIIPLKKQSDAAIAHIFGIADSITIRPGGMATLEAVASARRGGGRGRIYMYAELPMLKRLEEVTLIPEDYVPDSVTVEDGDLVQVQPSVTMTEEGDTVAVELSPPPLTLLQALQKKLNRPDLRLSQVFEGSKIRVEKRFEQLVEQYQAEFAAMTNEELEDLLVKWEKGNHYAAEYQLQQGTKGRIASIPIVTMVTVKEKIITYEYTQVDEGYVQLDHKGGGEVIQMKQKSRKKIK